MQFIRYCSSLVRLWSVIIKKLPYIILITLFFSCAPQNAIIKQPEEKFSPLSFVVHFYRGELNHLSAVRGSECPMYPSCSTYSLQCLKQHGFFIGWMMSCDRLMRCGRDELHLSPSIRMNVNTWKCYDPVKNNDFWWYKEYNNKFKNNYPWDHER